MKKVRLIPIFFCIILFVLLSCTEEEKYIPYSDPIATLGHGEIIGHNGEQIKPTPEFIESIQNFYLKKLMDDLEKRENKYNISTSSINNIRKTIYDEVDDNILANALLIDWLLDKSELVDLAHLTIVNNALRWEYVLKMQENPILPKENLWAKGLQHEIGKRLEKKIGIKVLSLTNSAGEAYCNECLDKGVPVPKYMFGDEWEFVGEVKDEFLSDGLRAELWIYESESPKGVCLALPRFPANGNKAQLFGVICLGTQVSKACFFDNPAGTQFQRNTRVDFKRFVGGTDLVPNGQGICTDCHSGENPYVVHPEKLAFSAVISKIQSMAWYDPLIDVSWPQNPGPTNLLDAVSSTGKCTACHRVGSAGRFPDVSNQLPGYCQVVLKTAAGTSSKRTMPMPVGSTDRNLFLNHINALQTSCEAPPTDAGVVVEVDYQEDPNFISAPIVIDPLYQCATKVAVRGAVLDAKVVILINGTQVGTVSPARTPHFIEFSGLSALQVGDIVTARQEKGGITSAESPKVIVRDHKVDFPNGLPAPTIDPSLIYECAEVIAIRHVPGATLTILTNGGNSVSYISSHEWTIVKPGKWPFAVGDKFTAKVSLCSDSSPTSIPETAVAAPSMLPAAKFNPETVYSSQELVTVENLTNGTKTKIGEVNFGMIGGFTTPVSWKPDFDIKTNLGRPLNAGERLWVTQELCSLNSTAETKPAEDCKNLPAPRIQHPTVGAKYVVVTQAIPGARIRVYDNNNSEIGDGSGTVIMLSRPITGADTLTVVQQVGMCTSKTGYRLGVRNPNTVQEDG